MQSAEHPSLEWKNETSLHANSLKTFLHLYARQGIEAQQKYNAFSELHFSGSNLSVHDGIAQGTLAPFSVEVLYSDAKPEQIHAIFNTPKPTGQNIDVYLFGNALEDYLVFVDKNKE